jgi:hypothetical protein
MNTSISIFAMKICNHEMNITALEPTILLFLDINAGILIDGEKL